MLNWIIIVLLVVVGIIAIKMNHLRHRIFIIILILIALFFYVTLTFVSNKNNVDLTTMNGFMNGVKVYGGWLVHNFQNIRSLTGNAINMDWTATNGTIFKNNSNSTLETTKVPQVPSVKVKK